MRMKKYVTCLMAVLMMGMTFTACNKSNESETVSDSDIVHEAPETSPELAGISDVSTEAEQEHTDFEPAYTAESGQAYLAIVGSQWEVQYWGTATKDGYMLAYNAGIADIKGDGSYKVSVSADTKGFRYDMTGSPDGTYTPEGLEFLAVVIQDGETCYPDAVVTIDSVLVDGNEIELTAKNYTASDDGKETRANLYNSWVSSPPVDARTPDGALYDEDGDAMKICKDYSAQIVNPEDFANWTTVEVNFTITGTDGSHTADNTESEISAE